MPEKRLRPFLFIHVGFTRALSEEVSGRIGKKERKKRRKRTGWMTWGRKLVGRDTRNRTTNGSPYYVYI